MFFFNYIYSTQFKKTQILAYSMKKKIFTSFIGILLVLVTYGQTGSKNKEHCKFVMSKKSEVIEMISIFKTTLMSADEKEELKTLFYQSNQSIFNIVFFDNDIIKIYHISDISITYLKEALISQNYYSDFLNSIEYTEIELNNTEK